MTFGFDGRDASFSSTPKSLATQDFLDRLDEVITFFAADRMINRILCHQFIQVSYVFFNFYKNRGELEKTQNCLLKARQKLRPPRAQEIVIREINEIIAAAGAIKLHLACGTCYKFGWINIDSNTLVDIDLPFDLRNALPFGDNDVDFIYHEHFLEHLSAVDGVRVLKDGWRVLKRGGVMRISVPDLEQCVNDYLVRPQRYRAEALNNAMRGDGHQWLYDFEEMTRRLQEAGFQQIERCKIYESQYPALQYLDRRANSLIVEAVKS